MTLKYLSQVLQSKANIFQTTELTRLQVGEGKGTANIIVSTLIEAENVAPLLVELRDSGREVNVCSHYHWIEEI